MISTETVTFKRKGEKKKEKDQNEKKIATYDYYYVPLPLLNYNKGPYHLLIHQVSLANRQHLLLQS